MADATMNEIIQRIKQRRLELGYSFNDLAQLTGISKSTLQRYETGGIKNIPLDKLKVLSTALQVTPEWIMGWQENDRTALIDTTRNRLQKILSIRNINPIDLSQKTGIPKSSISQYLSGYSVPRQNRLFILAQALNVNEAWLMGADVPMEKQPYNDIFSYDNIMPIKTQSIPLLGEIACGEPIYADEDRESYIEIGTDIKADFCLRAKGDSMINARILDGDIVFIRKQPIVNNGEIAAVIIDDEATLKRVYYNQKANILQLVAENPAFPPLVYSGEELNQIRILGKAVAFQSDVR